MLKIFNRISSLRSLTHASIRTASKFTKETSDYKYSENKRFSIKTNERNEINEVDNGFTQKYRDDFFQKVSDWCKAHRFKYNDFNMEELKDIYMIVQSINGITSNKDLTNKFCTDINRFLNRGGLVGKFSNSENWEIFIENIHSEIFHDIKNTQFYLFSTLLMKSILSVNKNIKKEKYYAEIADSYNRYFLKKNYSITNQEEIHKLQLDFTELVYFTSYMFIICDYLDQQIRIQKSIAPDNESILFKERLHMLDIYTNMMMKTFKSLDDVPVEMLSSFYRFFSYDKKKFLNSTNYLLTAGQENESSNFKKVLSHALKGCIHFDKMDIFEKLIKEAIKWNKRSKLQLLITPPNVVFNDYFLLNGKRLEHDYNYMMDLWSDFQYVPNKEVIDSLCSFLKINKTTDCEYEINFGGLKDKGFIIENDGQKKAYFLPETVYEDDELSEMADQIKKQFICTTESMKFVNQDKIVELDEMLKRNKYKYVIDGMNVVYTGKLNKKTVGMDLKYLENTVFELNRNSTDKILIVFKEHMRAYKHIIQYLREKQNCDFFFLESVTSQDDKFVVYACLKSGNESAMVSRDIFKFMLQIDHSSMRFKDWMLNKKIQQSIWPHFHLIHPPRYQMRPHKLSQTVWLVPYFNNYDDNKNVYDSPKTCLLINKKKH